MTLVGDALVSDALLVSFASASARRRPRNPRSTAGMTAIEAFESVSDVQVPSSARYRAA